MHLLDPCGLLRTKARLRRASEYSRRDITEIICRKRFLNQNLIFKSDFMINGEQSIGRPSVPYALIFQAKEELVAIKRPTFLLL